LRVRWGFWWRVGRLGWGKGSHLRVRTFWYVFPANRFALCFRLGICNARWSTLNLCMQTRWIWIGFDGRGGWEGAAEKGSRSEVDLISMGGRRSVNRYLLRRLKSLGRIRVVLWHWGSFGRWNLRWRGGGSSDFVLTVFYVFSIIEDVHLRGVNLW
jgi:hypothetical protein